MYRSCIFARCVGARRQGCSTVSSVVRPRVDYDDDRPSTSRVPPPVQTLAAPITTAALAGEQLLLDSDPVRLLNTHAATLGRTSGQWRVAHERAEWNIYLQLAKARLSALVTVTALSGWAMAPSAIGLAHSPVCLVGCVLGTALMSASANTINQLIEVPYDAQMRRTQARPLVTGRVTTLHAAAFAAFAATAGCAVLATACNPLTAALGVTNIVLYAGVYTPLKRTSIACTWAGAVVGAIPPLMGWAAITGTLTPAAFTMAAMLYAWQFPHFNGLSWNLRGDYSRAGYRVMCVTNPKLCMRTTLRYALVQTVLCSLVAPVTGLTAWTFALDSLPLNALLVYLSYRFYASPDATSSRRLFRYSLVYLPALMLVMIIGKYARATDVSPI